MGGGALTAATVLGFGLIGVGALIALVAGLILIVRAFETSALWGLAYLFVPFAGLAFVVLHWDRAGKPALANLGGGVLMVAGIFVVGPGLQQLAPAPSPAGSVRAQEGPGVEAPAPALEAPESLPVAGEPIYSYRDDEGNIHMVSSLDAVPARYHDRVQVTR